MTDKISSLKQHLSTSKIKCLSDSTLSRYSTIGIGGKASLIAIAETNLQLEQAVIWAIRLEVPYLVIGKGSNLIISDDGYRGLAIINNSQNWNIVQKNSAISNRDELMTDQLDTFFDKEKNSTNNAAVLVRADSGIQVRSLTNALYRNGIIGLQWYAGIPATVGGAIYMNMHGGHFFFGDLVNRVLLLSGTEKKTVDRNYFNFGYDYSILHKTKEIILCAELILQMGDVKKAQEEGKNWAKQKSIQPQRSAGCIFHNLTEEQKQHLNLPTTSVGYLVDKVLNLKGKRIGDAIISTGHAAFIENIGKASAKDVYSLIQLIRNKAKEELQINLELEVELIGNFDS